MLNLDKNKLGWNEIEKNLNLILENVSLKLNTFSINKHGLLKLQFNTTDDLGMRKLGEILSWYFERIAAKTCQTCGRYGHRRKDLPDCPTLCFACYVPLYNILHETQGEKNVLSGK